MKQNARLFVGFLVMAVWSVWLIGVARATAYIYSSFDVPFAGATSTAFSGINNKGDGQVPRLLEIGERDAG